MTRHVNVTRENIEEQIASLLNDPQLKFNISGCDYATTREVSIQIPATAYGITTLLLKAQQALLLTVDSLYLMGYHLKEVSTEELIISQALRIVYVYELRGASESDESNPDETSTSDWTSDDCNEGLGQPAISETS